MLLVFYTWAPCLFVAVSPWAALVNMEKCRNDKNKGKDNANVRVLVADDDVVSRSVVCSWLRDDGYNVTEVDDGCDAGRAGAGWASARS